IEDSTPSSASTSRSDAQTFEQVFLATGCVGRLRRGTTYACGEIARANVHRTNLGCLRASSVPLRRDVQRSRQWARPIGRDNTVSHPGNMIGIGLAPTEFESCPLSDR